MEIESLLEFTLIAKLGSFSLAAEELFLSQSALSKHIMALEKELGVKLFNRNLRGISLTEAGTKILPYANQIIETKKDIISIAAEQLSLQKSVVNIASLPVMAIYDITGAIGGFHKEHPEINLSLKDYENFQIRRLIESGECELAFTRESEEESAILEYTPFYRDYLVAVLPSSHPLSTQNEISLLQLKNEGFLFMQRGTGLYDLCYKLCVDSGFTPNIKYTGRGSSVIDLVSQGIGVSLLMKRHADYFPNPGVVCVKVTPIVESNISLAKLKRRKLSFAAKIFWNYIKLRKT